MKFNEAFNETFDKFKELSLELKEGEFAIQTQTFKTLAFFWNMMVVTGGKFDDLVYIDKNKSIISIPLTKPKAKTQTEKTKPKAKTSSKTAAKDVIDGADATAAGQES